MPVSLRRSIVGCSCCLVLSAVAAPGQVASAGPTGTDAIVERLHAYLDAYEPKLSALIADEDFRQRTTVLRGRSIITLEHRRLRSDVGFLRLPGRLGWLAQRSVRVIDGSPVAEGELRLETTYASAGAALLARAKAVADGNARHNLGHARSINVPTLPLELLGRQHRQAFDAKVEGPARVGGRDTLRVSFLERPPGSIVAYDDTRAATAEVRAWIAVSDGALWRADVRLHPPDRRGDHEIRVEFAADPRLGMLVPRRLQERVESRPPMEGTAAYRNYRRFQTSVRIVPP